MSKDYLCKDCSNNNNGWCKARKMQGLKDITECNIKNNVQQTQGCIIGKTLSGVIEDKSASYKEFGKRDMFYNIQLQMLDIDKYEKEEDKFMILKQVMVNLEKILQIGEKVHGVALDYMLDEDIINHSKMISNHWFKEVGEYKER